MASWLVLSSSQHRRLRMPGPVNQTSIFFRMQGSSSGKASPPQLIIVRCRFPIDTRKLPTIMASTPSARVEISILVSIPRESSCIRFMRLVKPNVQTNMGLIYIVLSEPRSGLGARPMSGSKNIDPNVLPPLLPKEVRNHSVIRRPSSGFVVSLRPAGMASEILPCSR